MLFSTVAERAQRAATSENMQIEKAPTNQKHQFEHLFKCSQCFYLQRISLFGCVVSICSAFLCLVVL